MRRMQPNSKSIDREKQRTAFAIEEYKVKWNYLQHTEQMRDRMFGSFVAISGASLAFLVKDTKSILQAIQQPEIQIVLAFIAVFALFLCMLMCLQNRNYRTYTVRLRQLEEKWAGVATAVYRPPKRWSLFRLSVFRLYLSFPSLLGTLAVSALAYSLSSDSTITLRAGLGSFVIMFVLLPSILETPPTQKIESDA